MVQYTFISGIFAWGVISLTSLMMPLRNNMNAQTALCTLLRLARSAQWHNKYLARENLPCVHRAALHRAVCTRECSSTIKRSSSSACKLVTKKNNNKSSFDTRRRWWFSTCKHSTTLTDDDTRQSGEAQCGCTSSLLSPD